MKIKILGNTWEVREVTAKELSEFLSDDSAYNMGGCDSMNKRLLILKDLPQEIKRETLLHEIGHAIMYETSLNAHCSKETKEQYCEFLRVAYPIVQDVLMQVEKGE